MTALLLPHSGDREPPAIPAGGVDEPSPGSARLRVLIVEDDFLVAMLVEEAVRSAGMEVLGVIGTVPEAVEAAGTERPDIITMDINLQGGGSGIDAAIAIRRQFDIPCIFVTAYTDDDHIKRAEPANPVGWLAKPFSEAQLVEILRAGARKRAN